MFIVYEAMKQTIFGVNNMDGDGRRGMPKFSEILRRPRGEAEVDVDL